MRIYYSILIVALGSVFVFCSLFLMKKRGVSAKAMFFLGGIIFAAIGLAMLLGFATISNGQNWKVLILCKDG